MKDFTLALAQMSPKLGLVSDNVHRVLELAEEAAKAGAHLAVFPELCLTGYFLRDLAHDVAMSPGDALLSPLYKMSRRLDLVVSFVEESAEGFPHISAAYLSGGSLVHVHRKVYLPTYGMFEDARFYAHGKSLGAFQTPLGRMALLICEDFWHPNLSYLAALDGAQMILCPASSPARIPEKPGFASANWLKKLTTMLAGTYGLYVAYANRVGFEDGVGFSGDSHVVCPDGTVQAEAALLREDLILTPISGEAVRRQRRTLPLLRDEDPHLIQREMARILNKGDQP